MWSLVAAVAQPTRVIGQRGRLPWHIPLELRLFRSLTWGGILVMGRRTWESIGHPLPGRTVWVLSQQLPFHPHIQVFRDKDTLLQALRAETRPVFFAGGAEIFRWALSLPEVKQAYITWLELPYQGDSFFPDFPTPEWQAVRWELFSEWCISFIQVEYRRELPFHS